MRGCENRFGNLRKQTNKAANAQNPNKKYFFCEKVKIDCKTWSKIVNFMMHKQFFGDRLIRGIPRIEKIGRQVQTGIKMQDSGIFA